MNNKIMRSEAEIFDDLAKLCNSKGYLHAIAYFCFRDNVISVNDEVRKEDILKQYSQSTIKLVQPMSWKSLGKLFSIHPCRRNLACAHFFSIGFKSGL